MSQLHVRGICSVFSIGAALVAGTFALGTPSAQAAPQIQMKLSTPTLNDAQHEFLRRFKAEMEKRSHGRIKATIYPASQLGPIPRQIENLQLGAIQVFVCPPEFLDGVDPRFSVPSAVGVFKSLANVDAVLKDPEFHKAYYGIGQNRGIVVGSVFISGPTGLNTRTPVNHVSDIAGKKLRVLASPLQMKPISALGGTPVPMPLSEVLPALQQGAIDGVLSVMPVLAAFRYYDAAKYFTNTDFSYIVSQASISKVWLDKQPKDIQKIILDSARDAGNSLTPWILDFHKRMAKVWTSHGGKLIDLPKQEWAETMPKLAKVTDEVIKAKPALQPLYKTLVELANKH